MKNPEKISNEEHIAFLLCWLSSFVLCSLHLNSLIDYCLRPKCSMKGSNLTYASCCWVTLTKKKLLLGNLYSAPDDCYQQLQKLRPVYFMGPFWLLDFWVQAILWSVCSDVVHTCLLPLLATNFWTIVMWPTFILLTTRVASSSCSRSSFLLLNLPKSSTLLQSRPRTILGPS